MATGSHTDTGARFDRYGGRSVPDSRWPGDQGAMRFCAGAGARHALAGLLRETQGSLENARVPWEEAKIFRAGDEKLTAISAEVSDPLAPPEALAGGHGTSEYYMVDGFIQAVIDGQQPPIDIYRSLDFSVPGLCAHLSAQQGGTPVQIQDYRDF